MRRVALIVVGLVVFAAGCDATFEDEGSVASTSTTVTTTTTSSTTTTTASPDHPVPTLPPGVTPLAVPPIRHPAGADVIYFVMPDRFANGDPGNDRGGLPGGDPLSHGFLPADEGFFHGGDLAGLGSKLDYLQGMGITAIWVTPPFTNRVVQGNGTIEGSSAGYHGYWQIDYTRIDPHLGANDEMRSFVDAAHARGMKVYFDIVGNHTGDVITYAENRVAYLGKGPFPYLDAAGMEFDDAALAGADAWPELDPETSFPYTPTFADPADATVKAPDWLNDVTLYHNRGNSTFSGENSLYGDFFGLDDLFTEHPAVVAGMTDIFTAMIDDYDIDGFRVDTVKHVNDEFWEAVIPAVLDHAAAAGKDEFFVFGEVFGEDPIFNSRYSTSLPFPSLLDFGFSGGAFLFAAEGLSAKVIEDRFIDDDWFTDGDSNASMLVKFMGNHDIGRLGTAVRNANPGATDGELLRRMELAMELMFTSRGIPLIYYGDEQGFTGDGGDKAARQDMFPSQVDTYNDDDLIGTDATTADDNFDVGHALYRKIGELAELRADHPALATGNHHSRWSSADAGIHAFTRIDRDELVEYLVVLNNADVASSATFAVASPAGTSFDVVYGPDGGSLVASERPDVTVTVPALSTIVYRAHQPLGDPGHATTVRITSPEPGASVSFERFRIGATVDGTSYCGRTCWPGLYAEVTFAVRVNGGEWQVIGTDDAPSYRVFWDSTPYPDGALIEVMATVDDRRGGVTVALSEFTLGER